MKFKVGDIVYHRLFNLKGEVLFIDNNDKKVPYLVGFKGFSGHNGDGIYIDIESMVEQKGYKDQCWWCKEESLEPVKEEKKMKFKAGDRVKFKEDYLNNHLNDDLKRYVGKVLTIIDIFCGIGYYIEDESGDIRIWCCIDDVLEPVKEEKKMRNIDVILKDADLSCAGMCAACYRLKNGKTCINTSCAGCEFVKHKDCYEFLNAEYKPKIALNKFEHDLLVAYNFRENYCTFGYFVPLKAMKEKGHFKNVTDTSMKIKDILANCEVEE